MIVADIIPGRLRFAEGVGADKGLNPTEVDLPEAIRKITSLGADVVVDSGLLSLTRPESDHHEVS